MKYRGKRGKNVASLLLAFAIFLTNIYTPIFANANEVYSVGIGNVTDIVLNNNSLNLSIDNGTSVSDSLVIEVCQDNILRVNYLPSSISPSPDTPIIDPNLTWQGVNANINVESNPIIVSTSEMQIEINKNPCRMTVKKVDGTTLFWEPENGGVFEDGVRFVRATSSNMYGIHGYDCFSNEGDLLRNNNTNIATAGQQGNSGGPFMWSTAGYGILVDSDGGYPYTNSIDKKMEFYYGGTPTEGRRYTKSDVEYYIILGQPKDIMKGYSKITGTSPMMSKWSLGFSNFEWNINEEELKNSVDTYRAKNIPIDAYAIDYDWKRYGDDNYGEFTWNTNNFPSSSSTALKDNMLSKGINLIGITKPRIVTKLADGTPTIQGIAAEQNGYFYPGHYEYIDYFLPVTVRSIDPYNSLQRAWWWENTKDAFDKGIVGFWNDETDKVSSGDAQYWFGNYATLHLSQATYEGQRAYTNDSTRVWQTARNYYPGTQRYSTSIWSGDVATQFYKGERVSWAAGLNEQKAMLLSTINNGQMKWGSDGGGFNQNSGNIENPSPELYTRWIQFAALTPVFRVHGTNYQQRQPWYFGTTAEENAKAAIQLRYSLMPYMYSYERSAYDSGLGLVYPLVFDYPNDSNVANYTDAWMFGDYLLVAPITERGQSVKWIYLPEGNWIDYNRGTVYTGGNYIPYSLNSESYSDMPMFIKEGAIIPNQEVTDYIGQKPIKKVNVDIFPSNNASEFTYYDDDGNTYNYESNSYLKQKFISNGTITIKAKEGSYVNDTEYYYLAIHKNIPVEVKNNQENLVKVEDYNSLLALNGPGWCVSKDVYGDVSYVKIPAGMTYDQVISYLGSDNLIKTSIKYEAEYSSLSGNTIATKASVNNNHTGFSGTGFVDKFESNGAALTFYSKVNNSGIYNLPIRYANGDLKDKSLSVYVNGVYEDKVTFEPTGNWDTWNTALASVKLAAGNNSIKLVYDTNADDTGFVNIDYIEVPFYPEVILSEAEGGLLWGSASTNQNHWYYSGTGFVDGLTSDKASVSFDVYVPEANTYETTLQYANGTGSNKTLNLYVNDTFIKTVNFTDNGGSWNIWRNSVENLELNKGSNRITYRFDTGNSGNINLDVLKVKIGNINYCHNLLDNGNFERNLSLSSNWAEWHPQGQSLAFGVDSGSGTNPPESPQEGDKRAYFHLNSSYKQSIHQGLEVENGTYNVEAWVKVSNKAPVTARMEVKYYGGNDLYYDMPTQSSSWTKITLKDIKVTNGYIDVGFYVDSTGGTTVHIDNVKLVKITEALCQ